MFNDVMHCMAVKQYQVIALLDYYAKVQDYIIFQQRVFTIRIMLPITMLKYHKLLITIFNFKTVCCFNI